MSGHAWRDLVTTTYRDARDAWELARETGENMQLEDVDYAARYPAPTFKSTLVGLAGERPDRRVSYWAGGRITS